MSDIALSVQNLSKSYRIAHQGGLRGYRTLHDELTSLPRRLINRLRGGGRSTSETFWALKDVSFDLKRGEALEVGDVEFQQKCLDKMENVVTTVGRTVVFVSHDMDAICHICSRCILLKDGEIAKTGDAADVVAAYLGGEQDQAPEINFAPIDSDASLRFAGLYNPLGEAVNAFSATEPIALKCAFRVGREIEGLQFSFSVFNFKGDRIF